MEDIIVTVYDDVYGLPVGEMKLSEIYAQIKEKLYEEENDEYKRLEAGIRLGLNTKEDADTYKKTLPGFTVSAQFVGKRQKLRQYIRHYTGAICLDGDDIANPIEKLKEIKDDPYVKMAFISPSGTGVKIIVLSDNTDWQKHEEVFKQTSKYFFEKYQIVSDEQPKNVNALCFFGSDENAIWNE